MHFQYVCDSSVCDVRQRTWGGTDILGLARDWTESHCLCLSDLTNWIGLLSARPTWRSFSVLIVLSHSPHLAALCCLSASAGRLMPDMWPTYGRVADETTCSDCWSNMADCVDGDLRTWPVCWLMTERSQHTHTHTLIYIRLYTSVGACTVFVKKKKEHFGQKDKLVQLTVSMMRGSVSVDLLKVFRR